MTDKEIAYGAYPRLGKCQRLELMKKFRKWDKKFRKWDRKFDKDYRNRLKSVNCVDNCGYDENDCHVPMRICNFCVSKDKCECKNKEIK